METNMNDESFEMDHLHIFKEGWLHKRGELIKTWRSRYFVLKSDGYFYGYNSKPTPIEIESPNNKFYVKDCKILTSEKPKANVFIVNCLNNDSTPIERVFATSSVNERDEWIRAIQMVSNQLNGNIVIDKQEKVIHKITLHDFEFLKILGKGTFGKVILCRERNSRRLCAMKVLKKSLILDKKEIAHTETENQVMRTIKNPFITSLIYSFQTTDRLCFVMEYVNGGELFFHLSREKRFVEPKARFYCAEISYAIGFLHKNNILYRDIKLENILLDSDGHIKLADFGLCKMNMDYESKTATFCGTFEYLAPEIVCTDFNDGGGQGYTRAVDWWAVGVVLYEMLTGRLPFSAKQANLTQDHKSLFEKIAKEEVRIPNDISDDAKSILLSLLEKHPAKRLGSSKHDFDEIRSHSFFRLIDWQLLGEKKLEPPFKPKVVSETDTSYFEKEFTGENVQLTPPHSSTGLISNNNYSITNNPFDSFSFYGSKTSLYSQKSIQSNRSKQSADKFDTFSLLNEPKTAATITDTLVAPTLTSKTALDNNGSSPIILKRSKLHHGSICSDINSFRINGNMMKNYDETMSCFGGGDDVSSNHHQIPNRIQFSDSCGYLFEAPTYLASSSSNAFSSLANTFLHHQINFNNSNQTPVENLTSSISNCDNLFLKAYFSNSNNDCNMAE